MTARRASRAPNAAEARELASFRELNGIGAAKEARLHEAGICTWAALAEVVAALGTNRGGSGDRMRKLSDQLTGRASAAGGDTAPRPAAGRSWRRLAGQTGHGTPPDPLPLQFETMVLPPGLQRLRLQLTLRLPAARRDAPALELVSAR